MTDYPFKKKNKKEFQDAELLTNFISFIQNYNHAGSNNSNDNRVCDNNSMIDSDWDAQSSDWSIKQQSKEKI